MGMALGGAFAAIYIIMFAAGIYITVLSVKVLIKANKALQIWIDKNSNQ